MGRIKDITGNYDIALMAIAAALVAGGIIGLRLGRPVSAVAGEVAIQENNHG
jgi:hypothetical protein